MRSLQVQAEIIAGAIAASATVETDSITIDPDRLLELQLGETLGPDDSASNLDFPINPERVAPVLRRLISPTNTRARIYDRDGVLVLDSRNLYGRGDVLRYDLPSRTESPVGFFEKRWNSLRKWLARGDLPIYQELDASNGKGYPEVVAAMTGTTNSIVRINARGEVIVSVATPVQRFHTVRGVLLLSTQGADIEQMLESERIAILKVFLIAAVVMTVLSMFLARTIAGPVRRLADAAERVRRRVRSRVEIPDFTTRRDEIGDLSGALREMTNVLYSRIEAIESFAADVAHELKNPLTSLRSAVETIPLAKTRESQERLFAVIQHDVRRLDRLISDISDASGSTPNCSGRNPLRSTCTRCSPPWSRSPTRSDRTTACRWHWPLKAAARRTFWCRATIPVSAGDRQPDRQCALLLLSWRQRARHRAAAEGHDRDRGRRRRPRHPSRRVRESVRALLYRPSASGLRQ